MIKIRYTTNLDSCKMAKFPEELPAVPAIGSRIRAIVIAAGGIMAWVVAIKAYRLMTKLTTKYPLTK